MRRALTNSGALEPSPWPCCSSAASPGFDLSTATTASPDSSLPVFIQPDLTRENPVTGMVVLGERTVGRKSYVKARKTLRGVYNGTVGGMSISPTCESPSAH